MDAGVLVRIFVLAEAQFILQLEPGVFRECLLATMFVLLILYFAVVHSLESALRLKKSVLVNVNDNPENATSNSYYGT